VPNIIFSAYLGQARACLPHSGSFTVTLNNPRRSKSGWICIGIGGGFGIEMPGGFDRIRTIDEIIS
jgi:hypothetical protein